MAKIEYLLKPPPTGLLPFNLEAAKNAAPAPTVDPMSQMMQMMLMSKMMGGNGKKNFFDN